MTPPAEFMRVSLNTTLRKRTCEPWAGGCDATDVPWRIAPIKTASSVAIGPRRSPNNSWEEGPLTVWTSAERTGDRMDRRTKPAGQRTHRAAVRHPAGPPGERNASGRDRYHRGRQSLFGDALSSRVGAAFYGGTAKSTQCPSTAGGRTSPGRNLECARSPQSGSGPHGKLGGKPLGRDSGRSLCGTSWSCGRDRTALGWNPLVALPRPLSAPAPLPRTRAAVRKSFRPTASRTCGTNTKTQKQNQTQIPCACRSPLEKTMEADISILLKTGHFYFALTHNTTRESKFLCGWSANLT